MWLKIIISMITNPKVVIALLALIGSTIYVSYRFSVIVSIIYFIIAGAGCLLLYFWSIYNMMNKMKPKQLEGIPMPPLSGVEAVTGHGNLTVHPKLKHILRLDIHDRANVPYFQTVFQQRVSIFISDAKEAARLLKSLLFRGPIYNAYRSDPNTPDMFASDNVDWSLRNENLKPALSSMKIKDTVLESIMNNFENKLKDYSETSKPLDLNDLAVSLAFDAISAAAFNHELEALKDSTDGQALLNTVRTLTDLNKTQGLNVYYYPDSRKVPEEEIERARLSWRGYLAKIVNILKTETEQYKLKHGELQPKEHFTHALVDLCNKQGGSFGDKEITAEVSQVLRHGYEMISAQLTWLFYVLYSHPQVRAKLELAVANHKATPSNPYPEYLECVIKETFRRYPAAGNFIARTVEEKGLELKGSIPATAPAGTLIQLHMFSIHNTIKQWTENPQDFNPDRWLNDSEGKVTYPKCPFLSAKASSAEGDAIYDGVGFTPGTLAYFPFSGGARSCPGKGLTLTIMREVLKRTVTKFRLNGINPTSELDIGHQLSTSFAVSDKQNTTVKVSRITADKLGVEEIVVAQKKVEAKDEGWANDEDEEEGPELIVKPNAEEDDDEVPDLVDSPKN